MNMDIDLRLNIRFLSQEKLEQYHTLHCDAAKNKDASLADGIPYTYHEVYAELVRRAEQEEHEAKIVRNNKLELDAFQWMLKATDFQISIFVEEMRERPSNVFPEYIFAFDALMLMAED